MSQRAVQLETEGRRGRVRLGERGGERGGGIERREGGLEAAVMTGDSKFSSIAQYFDDRDFAVLCSPCLKFWLYLL